MLLFCLVFLVATSSEGVCADNGQDLVIGVRADAPPFSSYDGKNEKPEQAQGYTVALCRLIADQAIKAGLYCKPRYEQVKAADRFDALKEHKIHMLCGATTVTLERMRAADFTLFTFLSGASVMYREGLIQKKAAKDKPLRIGVLENTTTEAEAGRILRELQKSNQDFRISSAGDAKVKPLKNHYEGLAELKKGAIVAYVADREILLALRQETIDKSPTGKTDIVVSEDYYTVEQYAIGIEIGNSELRYIANRVLSELYDWDHSEYRNVNIYTILSDNFKGKRFSTSLEALFRLQRITEGQRIIDPAERKKCY